MSEDQPESQPASEPLPEETEHRSILVQRPTWELELLISAAVVFSLFQLPGMLGRFWSRVDPWLSDGIEMPLFMVYYVGTLAAYALIVAFVVHFVLRSFWVGLCGLMEAFPKGIDWDCVDIGPISRVVYRKISSTPRELERQVDRMASSVFSMLFAVLISIFIVFVYIAIVLAGATALRQLLLPELNVFRVFVVVMVLFSLPMMLLALFEQRGKKDPGLVDRWPRVAGVMRSWLTVYSRATLGRLYYPIFMTFSSNISARATTTVMAATMMLLGAAFILVTIIGSGRFGYDSFTYFPRVSSIESIDNVHYEDRWGGDVAPFVPFIESDVAEGSYVRLFVPWSPSRDNERAQEICGIEPLRREGIFRTSRSDDDAERAAEVLECLRGLVMVDLDGEAVDPASGSLSRHDQTKVRGLLFHIRVAELEAGRHALRVRLRATEDEGSSGEEGSSEETEESAASTPDGTPGAGAAGEVLADLGAPAGSQDPVGNTAADDRSEAPRFVSESRHWVIPFWI